MSKLKQFYPDIKASQVLERKNNSFMIIGDTPQDIGILQSKSKSKMKACLGQKVKISLPKAYQTAKPKKSLIVKGVLAKLPNKSLKNSLTLTKSTMPRLKDLPVKRMVES